ncbi:MAG: hypothetical protein LBC80_10090 [Treponema sp.]|jgi:hypothetical protein|nr:hypothetical protein [Treponema sp.]
MKLKLFTAPYFLFLIVLFSCVGQNNNVFIPDPDFSVYAFDKTIVIGNIIDSRDGVSAELFPEWLLVFLSEGVRAAEITESYSDKYLFIAKNDGENFTVLNKWAQNMSATHDLSVLVGNRIEERMILNASLYPDDEYGEFFRLFIKDAFSAEYPTAVKEDIYWIKHSQPEVYTFFIKFTVDKNVMQQVLRRMMSQAYAQAYSAAASGGSQAATVNRLRQTFFEGF